MVLARYLCSVQVPKFDEYFIKIVPNDPKRWSQIVELMRSGIPKRFFGFGARILRIGHFSGWKWKFFEISSWHFKHPIKLNFLIWHLERPYPDKKSILEKRQFKSCPFNIPKSKNQICGFVGNVYADSGLTCYPYWTRFRPSRAHFWSKNRDFFWKNDFFDFLINRSDRPIFMRKC